MDQPTTFKLPLPEGDQTKTKILVCDDLPAWYDVDSIRISNELVMHLSSLRVMVGGFPVLALNHDMLSRLDDEAGFIEVLRPWMASLPLSRLRYHETHIEGTFLGLEDLPPCRDRRILLSKRRSCGEDRIVPMVQPQSVLHERCYRLDNGTLVAPNEFGTSNGLGYTTYTYKGQLGEDFETQHVVEQAVRR